MSTKNELPKAARGFLGVLLLVAMAAACGQSEPDPGPWPQWRGPGGQGISSEVGLPVSWKGEEALRWAVELPGQGISSPIVGVNSVYVTVDEDAGGERGLSLLALESATGATRWKTEILQRPEEKLHRMNRAAAATPVTDGETVFVYLGSHLAAVDLEGTVLWLEEIDADYLEHSRYGTGSSLILDGDHVIVFQDLELWEDGTGWLAAYRKSDGGRVWITEWDDSCCSYTTPILLDYAGETEILVSHARKVISYRASTGEILWEQEQTVNQPVASPVAAGDLLCSASGAHGVREMGCWRLAYENGERKIEPLWESIKGVPGTASPLLYNGLFYAIHEKGFIASYDPRTGDRLWQKRLRQGGYHASLVAGDDKIYAISSAGVVSVLRAGPAFELMGESPLPEGQIVASPAIGDGCLLVRTGKHLYCIEGNSPETAATPAL